ncbi:MAG: RluA family pseudouridine synthase [Anaerolineae bacterium]|nr:RluA family pseudouridine synthase [Anaerolineae bacterium]
MTSQEQLTQFTVDEGGQRLDLFVVAAIPTLSRTEVQRLIKAGLVTVNGQTAKSSYQLSAGEAVSVSMLSVQTQPTLAEDIPLDVLYEDDDLVAINKPCGLVVHPAIGNESGTLVNAALMRWPDMCRVTGEERAGIVHRLDKDTSGVIVMAKTPDALKSLQTQFHDRLVYKRYIALVEGIPEQPSGIIEAPIGRNPKNRRRMAVVQDGREAVTRYDITETFEDCALISVEIKTGRTHQIRVHMGWLGHPVVADAIYGRKTSVVECPRLFLHAAELQVTSPSTGERLHFESQLPSELQAVLKKLRQIPIYNEEHLDDE